MSAGPTGRVVAVSRLPLGDVLAQDAPDGATSLFVEDAADFSEDGGHLFVGSEVLTYGGYDDDSGEIFLTAPTTVDYFEGDRVAIYDFDASGIVAETVAQVIAEGTAEGGDSLEAIVDHALIPYLPEGIRDSSFGNVGESVELDWRGDDLYVVNIVGQAPVMDGTMIDPTTLPEVTVPTAPPAASPALTVEGMPSSLLVKTTDLVVPSTRIQFHVSTTSGFTPSPDTLAAETRATVFVLNALPTGEPLSNEVVYYVRAVALNDVGEAPPSAEVAGITDPEAVLELAVARVVTGFVLTGAVQVGQILIDADEGITIPSGDGMVRFPVDGSVSSITADIVTTALTMQGVATVQDLLAVVGVVELADAGVTDPTTLPVMGSAWQDLQLTPPSGWASRGICLDDTGDNYVTHSGPDKAHPGQSRLSFYSVTTGALTGTIDLSVAAGQHSNVVRIGSHYFLWSTGTSSGSIYPILKKYDLSGTQVASYAYTTITVSSSLSGLALGSDGTNVLLAWVADGDVKIRTYDTTGTLVSGSTYPMPASGWSGIVGAARGTYLYGATRTVVHTASGTSYVFNGTTEQSANRFNSDASVGVVWVTDHFEALRGDPTLHVRRHAPTATARTVSASYTWYDGVATGGTHETLPSPAASASIPAGKFVSIEAAPAPSAGSSGTDAPRLVRVYAGTPTRTLQATLAEGTRIATFGALVTGAAEPASNTFVGVPGLAPGVFRSEATDADGPLIDLRGDGSGRVGPHKWAAAGAAGPSIGSLYRAAGSHTTSIANATTTVVGTGWVGSEAIGTGAGAYFSAYSAGSWTMAVAGTFHINASISYANHATGRRIAMIYVNGAQVRRADVGSGGLSMPEVSHYAVLAAGDVVTIRAYQSSGGALALYGDVAPHEFQIVRVS